MIEDHWNYTFIERKQQFIDLDPSYIESGDYFTIRKWDGLCTTVRQIHIHIYLHKYIKQNILNVLAFLLLIL
jgi:hypothetical protein